MRQKSMKENTDDESFSPEVSFPSERSFQDSGRLQRRRSSQKYASSLSLALQLEALDTQEREAKKQHQKMQEQRELLEQPNHQEKKQKEQNRGQGNGSSQSVVESDWMEDDISTNKWSFLRGQRIRSFRSYRARTKSRDKRRGRSRSRSQQQKDKQGKRITRSKSQSKMSSRSRSSTPKQYKKQEQSKRSFSMSPSALLARDKESQQQQGQDYHHRRVGSSSSRYGEDLLSQASTPRRSGGGGYGDGITKRKSRHNTSSLIDSLSSPQQNDIHSDKHILVWDMDDDDDHDDSSLSDEHDDEESESRSHGRKRVAKGDEHSHSCSDTDTNTDTENDWSTLQDDKDGDGEPSCMKKGLFSSLIESLYPTNLCHTDASCLCSENNEGVLCNSVQNIDHDDNSLKDTGLPKYDYDDNKSTIEKDLSQKKPSLKDKALVAKQQLTSLLIPKRKTNSTKQNTNNQESQDAKSQETKEEEKQETEEIPRPSFLDQNDRYKEESCVEEEYNNEVLMFFAPPVVSSPSSVGDEGQESEPQRIHNGPGHDVTDAISSRNNSDKEKLEEFEGQEAIWIPIEEEERQPQTETGESKTNEEEKDSLEPLYEGQEAIFMLTSKGDRKRAGFASFSISVDDKVVLIPGPENLPPAVVKF